MTAPVIYDVTTDSFRPITQAEVNAMISRLNELKPPATETLMAQFAQRPPAGNGHIVPYNVWAAEATGAWR